MFGKQLCHKIKLVANRNNISLMQKILGEDTSQYYAVILPQTITIFLIYFL